MPLVINEIVSDVRVEQGDGDAKADDRLKPARNPELDRLVRVGRRIERDRNRLTGIDEDDTGGRP
jgi:hypothetical protein